MVEYSVVMTKRVLENLRFFCRLEEHLVKTATMTKTCPTSKTEVLCIFYGRVEAECAEQNYRFLLIPGLSHHSHPV